MKGRRGGGTHMQMVAVEGRSQLTEYDQARIQIFLKKLQNVSCINVMQAWRLRLLLFLRSQTFRYIKSILTDIWVLSITPVFPKDITIWERIKSDEYVKNLWGDMDRIFRHQGNSQNERQYKIFHEVGCTVIRANVFTIY